MTQTLDQKRAAFAWDCASAGMTQGGKEYKTLAKGAPALIMNSGLMPTLAFYKSKGGVAGLLLEHLLAGLSQRLKPNPQPHSFVEFMKHLQGSNSQYYLRYSNEALELLKWIRQFVDAVPQGGRDAAT